MSVSGNARSKYCKFKAEKYLELKVEESINKINSYKSDEIPSLQNSAQQIDNDSEASNPGAVFTPQKSSAVPKLLEKAEESAKSSNNEDSADYMLFSNSLESGSEDETESERSSLDNIDTFLDYLSEDFLSTYSEENKFASAQESDLSLATKLKNWAMHYQIFLTALSE